MRKQEYGSVTEVLVHMQIVGLTGLREAFSKVEESGLTVEKEILDLILGELDRKNYIPEASLEEYRKTLWREFKRSRGEDIRDLYSEIDVVVKGEAGAERAGFVEMMISVFADYELKPLIAYSPPDNRGPNPQLVIDDELVIKGLPSKKKFKLAVRKRISYW